MKFSAIILGAIACVAQTGVAVPVGEPEAPVAQVNATFEGWSDILYKGHYKYYEPVIDQCYDLRSEFPPGTEAGLSSMRVGPVRVVECNIYATPDCTIREGRNFDWGDVLSCAYVYDGLDDPEIGWPNKAQSFKCYLR